MFIVFLIVFHDTRISFCVNFMSSFIIMPTLVSISCLHRMDYIWKFIKDEYRKLSYNMNFLYIWNRNHLDNKLSYNNSCDRIRSTIFSMGRSTIRLDCWSCHNDPFQPRHFAYFINAGWMLSLWRSHFWKEKLYICRCSAQHSW